LSEAREAQLLVIVKKELNLVGELSEVVFIIVWRNLLLLYTQQVPPRCADVLMAVPQLQAIHDERERH
jgi:hypothetical protein